MSQSDSSRSNNLLKPPRKTAKAKSKHMTVMDVHTETRMASPRTKGELLRIAAFLKEFSDELEDTSELFAPGPFFRMALHLIQGHLEAKTITPTSLIGASRVPYATANRRMKEMLDAGLIEQRARTKTGKSFSMHPSVTLLELWGRMSGRVRRMAEAEFGGRERATDAKDYYFGGSYMAGRSIQPLQVLPEPLKLSGGVRVLVHGDPTFMVMDNLKRQFEQVIGTQIHQRAFSIDRLREEALRNAERKTSRYDIIAIDLPWVGEFAQNGILMP